MASPLANRVFSRARICTNVRQGVGIFRRQPGCSLPSGFLIIQPAMPTLGSSIKSLSICSSVVGLMMQSGFRKSTKLERVCLNARLLAFAKPRLVGFSMMVNRGSFPNRIRSSIRLASIEALSETNTSTGTVESRTDWTHSERSGPPL